MKEVYVSTQIKAYGKIANKFKSHGYFDRIFKDANVHSFFIIRSLIYYFILPTLCVLLRVVKTFKNVKEYK